MEAVPVWNLREGDGGADSVLAQWSVPGGPQLIDRLRGATRTQCGVAATPEAILLCMTGYDVLRRVPGGAVIAIECTLLLDEGSLSLSIDLVMPDGFWDVYSALQAAGEDRAGLLSLADGISLDVAERAGGRIRLTIAAT